MIVCACIFTFFSFIFQESLAEARIGGGLLHRQGHWVQQCMHGTCWKRCHYLHYLHHSLASGQTTGREHSCCPSTKNKIYGAWPRPSEQDPVSPSVSLCHQEASISLLSFSIRGQTKWNHNHSKVTKLITWILTLSNSMKRWAMPCRAIQDGQVMMESSDKTWSSREGNANHFSILALRTPWTAWKRKKTGQWKMNSLGR